MLEQILLHIQNPLYYWGSTLVLTAAFEILTIFCRFGLGISIKTREKQIKKFTLGVRIHHGYLGLGLMLLCGGIYYWELLELGYLCLLSIIGWVLLLSDLIHHFLVLKLITGNSEFP